MDMKISRRETDLLRENWSLLYGRRKTGKTYILRNFIDRDEYILIGKEGTIWSEGGSRKKYGSFDELADHVKNSLVEGKRIIIDEFQRMPMDQLEWISLSHPSGQLILSGSSMGVVGRITGSGSPLLGKFREVYLSTIDPADLLEHVNIGLDVAPYISDPWTIPFFGKGDILTEIYKLLSGTMYTVPSLVGEIFHEEDRNLSEIYQGILSSIGSGRLKVHEIATHLYGKGLIKSESASQIGPYVAALKDMGIIEDVRIFNKKRKTLRFTSQVMTFYYYMSSKYDLENGMPPFEEARENLKRVHSTCMEHYLVRSISKVLGGDLRYSFDPEIDGIVVDRKERPLAVLEVKWKNIRRSDVDRFREKTENYNCEKMILTRSGIKSEEEDIRILDEKEIISTIVKKEV